MNGIQRVVDKANENGHYIVDVSEAARAIADIPPGVFGICSLCGAYARYYKGQCGGEAYQTTCRENNTVPTKDVETEPTASKETAREVCYETATLNDWRDILLEYARGKGWATKPEDTSIDSLVALMHTELSELFEEYRNGHEPTETYYDDPGSKIVDKPEGIPSELADVIIRALHFAGIYGIDIEAAVTEKHLYNLTRPYRHGGKRV